MKIYRVEDANTGVGVYRSGAATLSSIGNWPDATHPLPGDDTLLQQNRNARRLNGIRFGFESVESLQRWFYSDVWLTELTDAGCVVNVYEVPPEFVCIGTTQLVFDEAYHTEAYKVDTFKLTDLTQKPLNELHHP